MLGFGATATDTAKQQAKLGANPGANFRRLDRHSREGLKMHYRCEIVMPPTDDVEAAVSQIMAPFSENADEEESCGYSFWDFWVIGGRFSGRKLEQSFPDERLEAFYAKLKEMGVTVSGVTCGKQELNPASQIPEVDALWVEMFPESGVTVCPLFSHSNNQYSSKSLLPGDICQLKDAPENTTCFRCIIAGPNYDGSSITATHMEQEDFWNGVCRVETTWDKTLKSALERFADRIRGRNPDYIAKVTPQPDWLVVTVDYHS